MRDGSSASNGDGRARILFMDDEEMLRRAVPRMLATAGYDVDCAKDGDEALRKYRVSLHAGRPYDLVILDLGVKKGKGGKETIAELREIDPAVRAIVSSGRLADSNMVSFEQFGFAGAIGKPYTGSELRSAIERVLAG
ncbi:MAG: response regulator [Candidatus Krumholzibacteriota bacterium]|nr:response regulator [Candidatus Krumholzibacteriota bacterium]